MVRNLVSWFLIVVFAVAFCGFIAGCQDDQVKEPAPKVEVVDTADKGVDPKPEGNGIIDPVVGTAAAVIDAAGNVVSAVADTVTLKSTATRVSILTDANDLPIIIELYPKKAPVTVENFLRYVNGGFYDGLVFHRVWPGFMVQGGGFSPELVEKQTRLPIVNEAKGGMSNARGTVAMARAGTANSATCQFFINVSDNAFLDYGKNIRDPAGYAVFGKVIKGMDVADAIVKVPTADNFSSTGSKLERCPVEPIIIKSIKVIK